MNKDDLATRVLNLLKRGEGCVVLIKGAWGTGKTYFWENSIAPYVGGEEDKKRKAAYVSLFGKGSIESIQNDVLAQLFIVNRHADKIKKAISSCKADFGFGDKSTGVAGLGIAGGALNLIFNFLEKDGFRDAVLCIDDFERKSESLKCVELIGYASILSERYSCNIVLLLDETKISESERGDYDKYKEKFVDYEFEFDIHQGDVIKSIVGALPDLQQPAVLDAITMGRERNLRVIKKAIGELLEINNICGGSFVNEDCLYIAKQVVALVCVYHGLGESGLKRINDQMMGRILGKDEQQDIVVLEYYDRFNVLVLGESEIVDWIWWHITGKSSDNDQFRSALKRYRDDKAVREYRDRTYELLNKFLFDIKCKASDFGGIAKEHFSAAPKSVIRTIGYGNFVFMIDSLKKITSDVEYWESYKVQQGVLFVDEHFQLHKTLDSQASVPFLDEVENVCAGSTVAKAHYESKLSELRSLSYTYSGVAELMDSIIKKGGWNQQVAGHLNALDIEVVREGIVSSPDFFEKLVDFIAFNNEFATPPFRKFVVSCRQLLDVVRKELLGDFRYERILKRMKYRD